MTEKEERFLLSLEAENKRRKQAGWVKELVVKTHTDIPCDIVVIDKGTRAIESIVGYLSGISNINRLKRLVERETGLYGDSLVVCVEQRKYSLGDILQDSDIIKL